MFHEGVASKVLGDWQVKKRQLTDDLARAMAARAEAERAAEDVKERLAALETNERNERKGMKRKLQEQFSRARAEVQATVDAVKREQTLMKAKEAKQRLIELERYAAAELTPIVQTIPLEQLQIGDQVEIGGLGMSGTLLESPHGKKRVRIKVGEGELLTTVGNLIGVGRGTSATPSPSSPRKYPAPARSYYSQEQTVVDVRGQTADEAMNLVVAALDRATLAGAPHLRIIHGHGTGKLKATLRAYLKNSPYVSGTRPGDGHEGGDGATVVTLR